MKEDPSTVWLQPQVRLTSGRVGELIGYEALLRPVDLGVIASDRWLPLRTVAAVAAAAITEKVSVNIELHHLYDLNVIAKIADVARYAGVKVMVEITERGGPPAADLISAISELGLRVALDDVPLADVDTAIAAQPYWMKFTGAALGDPDRLAAAVRACHRAGIVVVVEEIETVAQMLVAQAAGVDVGQGFLWSPPTGGADDLQILQIAS